MKENSNFRETLAVLRERFGKDTINAKELAEYLDQTASVVCNAIRAGKIPGKKVGHNFVIPLTQLAHWETERT